MALLRPFRGLRYTQSAGRLSSLIAPPTATLAPSERESFATRDVHNAIHLAYPEGAPDDRSKFVRYARSAARLAEWRRQGILAMESTPVFYRLVQTFGPQALARTALLATVVPDREPRTVEPSSTRARDERLRLLEATRTAFEPSVALYEDPTGARLAAIREAAAASETDATLAGVGATLASVEDPEAVARIVDAFEGTELLLAENAEGFAATAEFDAAAGGFVALVSLDDPSFVRLALHRVVRRLPGGVETLLAELRGRFVVEEHLSRNLALHVDRALQEGNVAIGLATPGGIGYLVRTREARNDAFEGTALGALLAQGETDPSLLHSDPIQAVRAADEGAAVALVLPRPDLAALRTAARQGGMGFPPVGRTYPAVPTGLVFRTLGDEG